MNEILQFLEKIEPLILVILPALFGIWLKVSTKLKEENKNFKEAELKKAKDLYNMWEHEESRKVIVKIRELCNVYKDRSNANQVLYMQLENGTIATSKLCNMFLTCLAEDNRYSEIPKKIKKLQRVPYSQMAEWTECVIKKEVLIRQVKSSNLQVEECFFSDVNSHMAREVVDKDGYLIGMVVFNYGKENYNLADGGNIDEVEKGQLELLRCFQASVESVFIAYLVARREKKRELGLTLTDDTESEGE